MRVVRKDNKIKKNKKKLLLEDFKINLVEYKSILFIENLSTLSVDINKLRDSLLSQQTGKMFFVKKSLFQREFPLFFNKEIIKNSLSCNYFIILTNDLQAVKDFQYSDFILSGEIPNESLQIKEGPLLQKFYSLGKIDLFNEKITEKFSKKYLTEDVQVCTEGEIIKSEDISKLLKVMGNRVYKRELKILYEISSEEFITENNVVIKPGVQEIIESAKDAGKDSGKDVVDVE